MTIYSVVIPTFNEEEAIAATIKSIQAQELKSNAEIEVIVADNGSTDKTCQIAGDLGAVVIENTTGKRVTISTLRNWGAAKARAEEIIAFVDGDMYCPPEWLQTALDYFETTDIACLGCVSAVPEDAGWVALTWFDPERRNTRPVWDIDFLPGRNIVMKKEALDAVVGFDEELVTAEDKDFTYRVRKAGYRVVQLDQPRVMHLGYDTNLWVYLRKEFWRQKSAWAFAKKSGFTMRTLRNPLLSFWHFLFLITVILSWILFPFSIIAYLATFLWVLPCVLIALRGGGKSPGVVFYVRLWFLNFLRWHMSGFGLILHFLKRA